MSEPIWARGSSPGVASSPNILACADYALARFRAARISMQSDSRLDRARACVARNAGEANDQPSPSLLAEATRTIFELYFIARSLGPLDRAPDRHLAKALARVLTGPDSLREEDENSSRPRNTQFELFFGAWLTSGNVPVIYAEPDLVMLYGEEPWGIAAKRVRSRSKLVKRVDEAADQVEKTVGQGMVILNVDRLLDELPSTGNVAELGARFDVTVPEFDVALERLSNRPAIRAFACFGNQMQWLTVDDHPRVHIVNLCKWRFLMDPETDMPGAMAWWDQIQHIQARRMASI